MLVKILVSFLIFSMNTYLVYSYNDSSNKNKIDNVGDELFINIQNKCSVDEQNFILLDFNKKDNIQKIYNTDISTWVVQEVINSTVDPSNNTDGDITSTRTTSGIFLADIGKKIETLWLTYISQDKEFSDFLISSSDGISKISEVVAKSLVIYSRSNKNNLETIIISVDWYINSNKNKELFTEVNKNLKSSICNYYDSHNNISASVFWVWEWEDESNNYISNVMSAWDWKWLKHYNKWTENHYYVALPYNDFNENWKRRSNVKSIPWYNGPLKDNISYVKNRWIKVDYNWKTAYGQWEDVWPLLENDFEYVFWKWKVKNTFGLKAWIDISPEFASYLWFKWSWNVNWNFVPEYCVPDGNWKKIVTKNNITW